MGFTGLLILARTETPLTDLHPLAGLEPELVVPARVRPRS
jgi:hypothetical protein